MKRFLRIVGLTVWLCNDGEIPGDWKLDNIEKGLLEFCNQISGMGSRVALHRKSQLIVALKRWKFISHSCYCQGESRSDPGCQDHMFFVGLFLSKLAGVYTVLKKGSEPHSGKVEKEGGKAELCVLFLWGQSRSSICNTCNNPMTELTSNFKDWSKI